MFNIYYDKIGSLCNMISPLNNTWIPWFIDIFIDDRDALIEFLKQHNIQTRPTYPEINKTPMYYSEDILPVSNYISNHGLFLPSHILLTNDDINYICDIIKLFYINKIHI